jgi:Zn-dependent peptidase ImmA (M78 family)
VCKCGKQSSKVETDPNLFAEAILMPQLLDVFNAMENDVSKRRFGL